MVTQGHAAAEPALRRAVDAFLGDQVSWDEWLQWGILAQMATMAVWDFDSWVQMSTRHVELARASGALAPLSVALNGRGQVATECGDFETATSLVAEKDVVNEVTGTRLASTCDLLLAGYRGRPAEAIPLFSATIEDAIARGEGQAVQLANWAAAVLHNGLGHYAEALAAAQPATEETYQPLGTQLVLPELIEAAVRTGRAELAREALERLSAMTAIKGSDWAKGLEARSRALLSRGKDAERRYAEAVERLGRTRCGPSSPVPTCSTASGSVASTGGSTHATSCAPPTSCSPRSALRPSPSAHAGSCSPPARRSASGRSTPTPSSPRRRSTSPGWPETGAPTLRSARNCSSAPAPWNGTSARCSPNWASPPAGTSTTPSPRKASTRHPGRRRHRGRAPGLAEAVAGAGAGR